MRRFVQVFGLKRDKHDHSQHRETHKHGSQHAKAPLKALAIPFLSSSSLTTTTTTETAETTMTPPIHSPSSSSYSTPHLSSASSNPSSHSSGSSSGSASLSLKTPEDERNSLSLARTDTKRSWKSWIGGKRSGSLKLRDRKDKAVPTKTLPDWDPPSLPIAPSLLTPTFQVTATKDDPDDDMHISSVSDLGYAPSAEGHVSAVPTPVDARQYLRISIRNKLIPAIHAAPFVRPASGAIYPRSCNPSQPLVGRPTLHSTLMRKRLLRRIDDHSSDLSPLEQASILPFASLPPPLELIPPPLAFETSIPYPDKSATILSSCPGLRKWICRPCFEDRFSIYLAAEDGDIARKTVSTAHAVAALDYSEALDVMVDPDFDVEKAPIPDTPPPLTEPVSPPVIKEAASKSTLLVASTSSSNPRRHSHTNTPSPLRNEHNASGSMTSSTAVTSLPPPSPSLLPQPEVLPKLSPIPASSVKRVVRFAENDDDDDDDGVPLHLLRMKKKREERSKFLRQERQRRMREAWEEQQRREQEAAERERKRIAAEKEKKEREKRLYGEQVIAARQRSEQSRAGAYAVSSSSSSSLLVAPLATSRDSERNRLQPSSYMPPRRETSEFGVQGSSSGGSPFSSRPASTYSASSEEAHRAPNSRRNSATPSMSGSMRSMPTAMRTMTYPYPGWNGGGSLNGMPPMPQLAAFAASNHDMPLLPPAAPFMRTSRPPSIDSKDRRQSSGSLGSVSSRNHSNSSLRADPTSPTSSYSQSDYRSSGHARQGSHESRQSKRSSTIQQRPQMPSSSSSHSRGRPSLSHSASSSHVQQAPTPWTALPSKSGAIPNAMPVSPYTHHSQKRSSSAFVGPMGHDWRSTLIS